MGLFDAFRTKKDPEISHPIFGRVSYQGYGSWEKGRAHFPPVGHEIEVIIEAGPEGPTEAHVQYWNTIIVRWPEIRTAADSILKRELTRWVKDLEGKDLWTLLDLESLHIHPGEPPAEWELMLWCEEISHWPVLIMRHWEPTGCFVDG